MQIMKALNYLRNTFLIFGGSLLLFGCGVKGEELSQEKQEIETEETNTYRIIYGDNKEDIVTANHATFDPESKSVWFYNGSEIVSVYYEVERVKKIDN